MYNGTQTQITHIQGVGIMLPLSENGIFTLIIQNSSTREINLFSPICVYSQPFVYFNMKSWVLILPYRILFC